MTLKTVREITLALPGVEEGPCYGTVGFRVRGRLLARLWPDGETLVVKCGDEERDFRLQADPATFFVTDHYKGYPYVLVRLSRVDAGTVERFIERRWRATAPKRLLKAWDAEKA